MLISERSATHYINDKQDVNKTTYVKDYTPDNVDMVKKVIKPSMHVTVENGNNDNASSLSGEEKLPDESDLIGDEFQTVEKKKKNPNHRTIDILGDSIIKILTRLE